MTSPLRSFVQFAPLERKLRQLAEKSPDWKRQMKVLAAPGVIEYEQDKARRWDAAEVEPSRLDACLDVVTAPSTPAGDLGQSALVQFQTVLLDRSAEGLELRQGPGTRTFEGHVCLDAAAVPRALTRFFDWTASKAFAEMHTLEQMALCQVRLYEIWPFEKYSGLTADFFCLRLLYQGKSLVPVLSAEDAGTFQEALSEAFGFVTKPLVDFYLRGCERACDQFLRQL